jgi:YD repeat-containing protein
VIYLKYNCRVCSCAIIWLLVCVPFVNSGVQAFNPRGNITTTTRYLKLTGGGERGITTSTAYGDSTWSDKPTSVTDALGRTTSMTYDVNGYLNSVTNPLGFTKTSTFNQLYGRYSSIPYL